MKNLSLILFFLIVGVNVKLSNSNEKLTINKGETLIINKDTIFSSINFKIKGNDSATLIIDAIGAKKPLTLKFTDTERCGIKPAGQIRCKGSKEYPIIITSTNQPPKNYFFMQGTTNRCNFEMNWTTISYSKGLIARYYYGYANLTNCKILHTEPGKPAISLIGAGGFLKDVLIKDCSIGIYIWSVYGRDIFVKNLRIENCKGLDIEMKKARPCTFYLKDSKFNLDWIKIEGDCKIISSHHNKTKDYYIIGSFSIPSIKVSKIHKDYRFTKEDNLHLRRIKLIVDEKSECKNLEIGPLGIVENPENLTIYGEKKILKPEKRGLLSYLPLNKGKGNIAYDIGARGAQGQIHNGNWIKGKYTKKSQIELIDPFLSLYWSMDEGKGEFLNNHTEAGFTEHMGKIDKAEWTEGKFGKCLKFSKNSIVTIPKPGPYIDRALRHRMGFQYGLTFEVWLNFSNLDNQNIASFPGHTLKLSNKKFLIENTGYSKKIITKNKIEIDFSPQVNKWYLFTFCNDFLKKKIIIYLDAKLIKEINYEKEIKPFSVWDYNGIKLGNGFNGLLDEVRIYSRCLTKKEIESHFIGKEIEPPFIEEIKKKLSKQHIKREEAWALEFNGKNTYVSIPAPNLTDEFTLSAWIKPDIPFLDSSIIEQSTGNPPIGIRFGINDRRLFAAFSTDKNRRISVSAGRSIISDNAVIKKGSWSYVALTYSIKNKKASLYFNGIRIKEIPVEKPIYYAGGKYMTISGCTPFPTMYGQFKGFIRNVKIYQKSLTDDEILNDYIKSASIIRNKKFFTEEEREEEKSNCLIEGKIIDEETGKPLEAQIYIKVNDKYYISKENCYWGRFGSKEESVFVGVGSFKLKIPPGKVEIKATRGFEYFPFKKTFKLKNKEEKKVVIKLKRLVDMPSLCWWSGAHHEHSWGHGKGVLYNKFASSLGWKYYSEAQKAMGFNYVSHPAPWDGGDFKSTWTDRFICWPTVENQVCNIYKGVGGGRDLVARMENLVKRGGHGLVQGYGEDNLQPGQVAIAMALDKIDAWRVNEKDWFKYLNLGFKSCIGQGSDYYFTYPLRKYIPQEYAKMDKLSWKNMIEAYKKHATFWTNGPLVIFKINGKDIGDTIILSGDKEETLKFSIKSWHIYGLNKIEVIKNGEIVKRFSYSDRPKKIKEEFELKVNDTCWFLVKVYGEKGEFAGNYAITSPIYIQFGKNPMKAKKEDIEHFISYIEKYRKYLEKHPGGHNKEKENKDADKAEEIYKSLLEKPRTYLDDKPILEEPPKPKVLEKTPSLILYLPFDEGKTEFAWDHSKNNYKVVLYNCKWTEGKKGKAIYLNNSHIPLRPLTLKEGISFLTWFKLKEKKSSGQSLFAIGYNLYGLQFHPKKIRWILGEVATQQMEFEVDKWYHLAITHNFKKEKVRFYVDGKLIGEYKCKGKEITNLGMYLGGWGHPYHHRWDFNGVVDELKIYNRALTDEEVKDEYSK